MSQTTSRAAAPTAAARPRAHALIARAVGVLDAVPYAVLAIPLRLAVAQVFWSSGNVKIADWDATLSLFRDEYQVPLLPPVLTAWIAATIELSTPPLLVLGLFTRPVALLLLGMTTIIEVFIYPDAWPVHIQWAAMLLVLLCRGGGALSLDHLIARLAGRR